MSKPTALIEGQSVRYKELIRDLPKLLQAIYADLHFCQIVE